MKKKIVILSLVLILFISTATWIFGQRVIRPKVYKASHYNVYSPSSRNNPYGNSIESAFQTLGRQVLENSIKEQAFENKSQWSYSTIEITQPTIEHEYKFEEILNVLDLHDNTLLESLPNNPHDPKVDDEEKRWQLNLLASTRLSVSGSSGPPPKKKPKTFYLIVDHSDDDEDDKILLKSTKGN